MMPKASKTFAVLFVLSVAFGADVPRTVIYQGKLHWNGGPATGGYYFMYTLDDDTTSSPDYRWRQEPSSPAESVWVQDGLFSDTLGLRIDTTLSAYNPLFLKVYVKKGFADTWTYLGAEELRSAPYALVCGSTGCLWADSSTYIVNQNAASDEAKVRIYDNGNVGIGVASPDDKLDVDGSVDVNLNGIKNVATPTTGAPAVGDAVSTSYLYGNPKATTTHFKLFSR